MQSTILTFQEEYDLSENDISAMDDRNGFDCDYCCYFAQQVTMLLYNLIQMSIVMFADPRTCLTTKWLYSSTF